MSQRDDFRAIDSHLNKKAPRRSVQPRPRGSASQPSPAPSQGMVSGVASKSSPPTPPPQLRLCSSPQHSQPLERGGSRPPAAILPLPTSGPKLRMRSFGETTPSDGDDPAASRALVISLSLPRPKQPLQPRRHAPLRFVFVVETSFERGHRSE